MPRKHKPSKIDKLINMLWNTSVQNLDLQNRVIPDAEIILELNKLENLEEVDCQGRTLLMYAILYEREQIVNYLLNRGAKVNCCDNMQFSPLHFAAQAGNISIIKNLLCHGADVNVQDSFGNSPLLRCKSGTQLDIFAVLIDNSADPYQKNNYGVCAMDVFCARNDIMEILLSRQGHKDCL